MGKNTPRKKAGEEVIVTTSIDETPALVNEAKELAADLKIDYLKRNKKPINYLTEKIEDGIFVVNSNRGTSYYKKNEKEVFFHPNMAFLRIEQLKKGFSDSFVSACGLERGMSFFDGTLGLASDALVAAYVVGNEGKVMGAEISTPLFAITRKGLDFYKSRHSNWGSLIDRITIQNIENLKWLRQMKDSSVDVVYFDFMFEKSLENSHGIQVIKSITDNQTITKEHVVEAARVAKHRIVAKSGYSGISLETLGFEVRRQYRRRNFYYGVIEMKK